MPRREEIIKLLEKRAVSIQQIANMYRTTVEEILEDFPHIKESIKPKKLRTMPAECRKCGFVFKERTKIKAPSKCPRCKSECIEEPLFIIE